MWFNPFGGRGACRGLDPREGDQRFQGAPLSRVNRVLSGNLQFCFGIDNSSRFR